ncbi:hypothetical protein CSOJ01_03451 [Colletotrichum sojae]|uniref:Uncharacterized protein n=1 Tax=Colletotrichum sojae TaxID=2175907 RepID=A0A8H6JLS5_9PEZI|nr:hypothetical protein CSOJ01_03451 [Colletotrichum sojae]
MAVPHYVKPDDALAYLGPAEALPRDSAALVALLGPRFSLVEKHGPRRATLFASLQPDRFAAARLYPLVLPGRKDPMSVPRFSAQEHATHLSPLPSPELSTLAPNLLSFHRSVLSKAPGALWHGTGLLGRLDHASQWGGTALRNDIALRHCVGILHAPDIIRDKQYGPETTDGVAPAYHGPVVRSGKVKPLGPWPAGSGN